MGGGFGGRVQAGRSGSMGGDPFGDPFGGSPFMGMGGMGMMDAMMQDMQRGGG